MAHVRAFSNEFLSPEFSDLEFRCGEATFAVHRSAVCKSPMMRAICGDGQMVDGKTIVVEYDNDRDSMERLFEFLYTKTYSVPSSADYTASLNHFSPENPLVVHVNVRAVAEYYDIPELETYAIAHFTGEAYNVEILDAVMFTRLLHRIYSRTAEAENRLFDIVLKIAFRQKANLLKDETFTNALHQDAKIQPFAARFLHGLSSQFHDEYRRDVDAIQEINRINVSSAVTEIEEAITKMQAQKQELEQRNRDLNVELSRAQREANDRGRTLAAREAELDRARADANAARLQLTRPRGTLQEGPTFWAHNIPRCRGCNVTPFQYNTRPGGIIVQCRKCRCRHAFNGY